MQIPELPQYWSSAKTSLQSQSLNHIPTNLFLPSLLLWLLRLQMFFNIFRIHSTDPSTSFQSISLLFQIPLFQPEFHVTSSQQHICQCPKLPPFYSHLYHQLLTKCQCDLNPTFSLHAWAQIDTYWWKKWHMEHMASWWSYEHQNECILNTS